jgi:hypothetical protein
MFKFKKNIFECLLLFQIIIELRKMAGTGIKKAPGKEAFFVFGMVYKPIS